MDPNNPTLCVIGIFRPTLWRSFLKKALWRYEGPSSPPPSPLQNLSRKKDFKIGQLCDVIRTHGNVASKMFFESMLLRLVEMEKKKEEVRDGYIDVGWLPAHSNISGRKRQTEKRTAKVSSMYIVIVHKIM